MTVFSTADQNEPVNSIPASSFQRNQYQKDIYAAAAKKLDVSVSHFLRKSALEKAASIGIT